MGDTEEYVPHFKNSDIILFNAFFELIIGNNVFKIPGYFKITRCPMIFYA
jgi:hypothetical protein